MSCRGKLVQEIRIPGAYARAFEVKKGQLLMVMDIEGQQVADFIAFNKDDYAEKTSPAHTRTSLLSLNMKVGDHIRSNFRRPMFEIVEDTVGVHDLLIPACDEQRYLVDYGVKNHRSCVSNWEEVLADRGITRAQLPDPINLFQSTRIEPDGRLVQQRCPSKAGDYVVFRALMDVVGSVSACPMDLNPIGGDRVTDIGVKIFDGNDC